MMKYKVILILVIAFAKANFTIAQEKINFKSEQEERVAIEDFPKNARSLIISLNKAGKKVRYYIETDGALITYEAKFKLNGQKYSVECDEDGSIIDIEVRLKKRVVRSDTFSVIILKINKISERFKVEKIQKQFVITDQNYSTISKRLENDEFDNYEMIVAFKENHKIYRKELLFSKNGVLLKQRDVKKLKYDFILF
ncbi:hypothetical protein BBFL7_01716 [Flavobacteria bacterium BBFL7]|nr:hypothetical protein BBFL7_01716 [Flavobacteria bacterium BBFL7]